MKFRYTILYVPDVNDAIAFYEAAFGLNAGFVHEAGDYGELQTGDTKLAFSSVELMTSLGKNPQSALPGSPTFEIALETDRVAESVDRAIAAGATLVQAPRKESWGQTTAYVNDPFGYLVEICSPVQLPNPG